MIEQFHFLRPWWLLALLPLFAILWLMLKYRFDSSSWRAVIDARLLPFVLTGSDSTRRRWPQWIFAIVGGLTILALAGPTWEKIPQPVYHNQTALVIALDLSRSMDATDIKPSRLARARHKIADILHLRKEGQTALVVYAADAFAVTPLTDDVDTILALLSGLGSELMPTQGSRADRALQLAFELFDNGGVTAGDFLLVSDGLNDLELKRFDALIAQRPAHRLSVLAIGTPDGGPIPLRSGGFLKDRDGAIVITGLLEASLRKIAHRGGGVYASMSSDDIDINALVYLMESSLDDGAARLSESSAELWRELGPWLILLALPLAALSFRRGLLWLIPLTVWVLPPDAQALDWQGLWQNPDQRASELFTRGEHAEAAQLFNDEAWAAASQYRAGDPAKAMAGWQQLDGEDAIYNRGNALAQLGRYQDAIDAYASLLQQNPNHVDARFNKERIEAWLDQQQNRQSENQQSQTGQNESQAQGSQQRADTGEDQTKPGEQAGGETNPQQQTASEPAQPQQPSPRTDDLGEASAETLSSLEEQMSEQATEQWLRKIPDDPGGLLRRKFLYQYRKRGGVDAEAQSW